MNGNGIDANALRQRQVLGGILTDIFGGAETLVSQVGDGVTSAIGGVTSAVGGVLTPIFPPASTGPATRTSASSTVPSSRSSSSVSSTTTSSTSSSSTSTTSLSSVFPTLSETTDSNGAKQTVTAFVTNTASSTPTTPPTNKSFLQNKPLSGFVFALSGIVGLVLVILIATFALRRRNRKKLENEAISYDPSIGRGSYHDDLETRLVSEKGSNDFGHHGGGAVAYGTTYAPTPHGMYYDQGRTPAYGQQPQYPNYAPRSPNPFDQNYAPGTNYNAAVGAPVPPRSPNPAYDPDRYSSELCRSSSRSSDNSVTLPQPAAPPVQTQVPASLLSGATLKSPPPAAVRPPTPPQLPLVFGDNGSVDERHGVSPIDLKVANQ